MVLEPFSALAVAGNILQFVEFGSKILSRGYTIYRSASGTTKETEELIKITTHLQHLCDQLSEPPTRGLPSKEDAELRKLTKDCKAAGGELLDGLQRLTLKKGESKGKWGSFRVALATVWKERDIESMREKLESYKSLLVAYLAKQARDMDRGQSSSIIRSIKDLQDENRKMGATMGTSIQTMRSELESTIRLVVEDLRNQLKDKGTPNDNPAERRYMENGARVQPAPPNDKFSSTKLNELATMGNEIATALSILKNLEFSGMRARHSQVVDAHPETSKWMFDTAFVKWLQSDEPIYWISGKPGSGKSTLMKFLIHNPDTTTYLRRWAGDKKLVTAGFFFWITGTKMQKSQEGLLRSLLYEIIMESPELVSVAFPSQWRNVNYQSGLNENLWTRQELLDAFTRLGDLGTASSAFCFFIDGMDEYDGNPRDLITVLKGFSKARIKLCLSSRPWNVFETEFGGDPVRMVSIQELTKPDMRLYVRDHLEQRSDFQQLKSSDPRYRDLTEELIEKAQGVFLWVFLVVRSLVDGLENCDRLVDLQRRLREFPSDLQDFFTHIFDSLEPVYKKQVARAFRVALAALTPLSPLNYWFLDLDEEDPKRLDEIEICPLHAATLESRTAEIKKRLNGRCKGLLEVTFASDEYQVGFLHRTVRDFLETDEMHEMLVDWSPGFNPDLAICRTTLAELKVQIPRHEDRPRHLVRCMVLHAQKVEARTSTSALKLLQQLEMVFSTPWVHYGIARQYLPDVITPEDYILRQAIASHLIIYVQYKLDQKKGKRLSWLAKSRPSAHLLASAVGCDVHSGVKDYSIAPPNIEMITLLLNRGADPNEWWGSGVETSWKRLLTLLYKNYQHKGESNCPPNLVYSLVSEFIKHRADLHAVVIYPGVGDECRDETLTAAAVIKRIFPPNEAAELLALADPLARITVPDTLGGKVRGKLKQYVSSFSDKG
ncbi:hypothetical protein FQN54_008323 [Arachnomyces sp. PD_36]|nr:hypothetical protein FQN54_008323 [Arachnomyces sp. PD_36]